MCCKSRFIPVFSFAAVCLINVENCEQNLKFQKISDRYLTIYICFCRMFDVGQFDGKQYLDGKQDPFRKNVEDIHGKKTNRM